MINKSEEKRFTTVAINNACFLGEAVNLVSSFAKNYGVSKKIHQHKVWLKSLVGYESETQRVSHYS